jgi:GT2 family glycosyltransferase
MMGHEPSRVGVVIVNWKGWQDTLLALETLFGSRYQAFDVVVVDNASPDDSIEHLLSWAEGREAIVIPAALVGRVTPREKPGPVAHAHLQEDALTRGAVPPRLTIIQASANRGFAAGNNIGLAYLRQFDRYDHYWLLNNDAFPAPMALEHLVARAQADPSLGQIGATLVYSTRPDVVQALAGAIYKPETAVAHHIGANTRLSDLVSVDPVAVEHQMNYVVGASILITRTFLDEVGPMDESYFLYFEEIDWAERGKGKFGLGYAPNSIVYHKAGGSTQQAAYRSALAAYYLARNRFKFTQRFHPACVATVRFGVFKEILFYVSRARWSEARGFLRASMEPHIMSTRDLT